MPLKSSESKANEINEIFNVPGIINIYKDNSALKWSDLRTYLENILGNKIKIDIREDFVSQSHGIEKDLDNIAKRLAKTKVFDISDPEKVYDPFPVEIEHEKEQILHPKNITGVMYDGIKMQNFYRSLIPENELGFSHLHIMFTSRLVGTWEKGDGRYHARVSVYGYPSIISTTGVVEAPAKPREFYVLRKALMASGVERELATEELKEKFSGQFIDNDDERFTDILKGYIMQAVFYHITFDPFCEDKNCRLFNAHWQEEMIHAQLEGKEFCDKHEGILKKMNYRTP